LLFGFFRKRAPAARANHRSYIYIGGRVRLQCFSRRKFQKIAKNRIEGDSPAYAVAAASCVCAAPSLRFDSGAG
jgi:hypothetical protein